MRESEGTNLAIEKIEQYQQIYKQIARGEQPRKGIVNDS